MKSLIITEIVQRISSEGAWGELQAGGCFRGQPWKGCMRQILVSFGAGAIVGFWGGEGVGDWGLDYNSMRF